MLLVKRQFRVSEGILRDLISRIAAMYVLSETSFNNTEAHRPRFIANNNDGSISA